MAIEGEGLRRSGRIRKPIKTYADEQAEQDELALTAAPASKRKRDSASTVLSGVTGDTDLEPLGGVHDAKTSKKSDMPSKIVDLTEDSPPSKKRKKNSVTVTKVTSNNSWHESGAERRNEANKRIAKMLRPGQEETRLRAYVDEPSDKFHKALQKANKERMFIIDRERSVDDPCHTGATDCPCEHLQIAGSKGSVYTVEISHLPSCTCPVAIFQRKGQEACCKHVLYVLQNVFKATEDDLLCQNAFLTSELRTLFANAAPIATEIAEDEPMDGNRKPLSDDCPICFMEFEEGENVVWCKAACGNNIHKACFDQWAQAKHGNVTCPFCRSAWQVGDKPKTQKATLANIEVPTEKGAGGYRNVRHLLDYD